MFVKLNIRGQTRLGHLKRKDRVLYWHQKYGTLTFLFIAKKIYFSAECKCAALCVHIGFFLF